MGEFGVQIVYESEHSRAVGFVFVGAGVEGGHGEGGGAGEQRGTSH